MEQNAPLAYPHRRLQELNQLLVCFFSVRWTDIAQPVVPADRKFLDSLQEEAKKPAKASIPLPVELTSFSVSAGFTDALKVVTSGELVATNSQRPTRPHGRRVFEL